MLRLPEKDVVYESAGDTREEWEAQNAAAAAKSAASAKRRKKKLVFKPQKKVGERAKKERQTIAPTVARMVEQMKSRGMSGLDRDGVNASKRRTGR